MVQHFIIWWLGGLETLVTVGCGYMFMLYFTASFSEGVQGSSEGANGLCSDDRRDAPLKSGLWHWSPCLLLPRAGITASKTLATELDLQPRPVALKC